MYIDDKYIKDNGKEVMIPVDKIHTVMPNNKDFPTEIHLSGTMNSGQEFSMVINAMDWLDTFGPDLFEQVKKTYINYIKQIK